MTYGPLLIVVEPIALELPTTMHEGSHCSPPSSREIHQPLLFGEHLASCRHAAPAPVGQDQVGLFGLAEYLVGRRGADRMPQRPTQEHTFRHDRLTLKLVL